MYTYRNTKNGATFETDVQCAGGPWELVTDAKPEAEAKPEEKAEADPEPEAEAEPAKKGKK